MKVKILLSLILIALLSGSAAAEFLDVNQPSVVTLFGGPIGERHSQSFTTGINTAYVTAFEWCTWNPGGTADTVKVDLREWGNPGGAGWESGALLGTKQETFVGAMDGDWLRVQFDTPIAVSSNTQYTIFITNIDGYAGYYYDNTDPYPGGNHAYWIDYATPPAWSIYYANDLTFRIYGAYPPGHAERAKNPTPASPSTVDKTAGSTLLWDAGDGAVTHKVYWSDDEAAVTNRTVTPIVLDVATDGNTTPTPSTPVTGKTYYWAVDEVDASLITAEGYLWTYTIQDYIVVDDMESYDGSMSSGNDAYDTWADGYGIVPSSGSGVHAIGTVSDPCGHDGTVQTMQYEYSNTGTSAYGIGGCPYYSEVVADTSNLACGSDWTVDGVAFLELWFQGKTGNDPNERMYIVIEDGNTPTPNEAMVQYGLPDAYSNPYWAEDMNNVKIAVYWRWAIDLRSFAGVNLGNVQKVYIGFGERGNVTTAGGTGTVLIDEIKLRVPGPYMPPDAWPEDVNNDGVVDLKDLAALANRYAQVEYDGTWPIL